MNELIDDILTHSEQWKIVLEKLRFVMATDYDADNKGIMGLLTDISDIVED